MSESKQNLQDLYPTATEGRLAKEENHGKVIEQETERIISKNVHNKSETKTELKTEAWRLDDNIPKILALLLVAEFVTTYFNAGLSMAAGVSVLGIVTRILSILIAVAAAYLLVRFFYTMFKGIKKNDKSYYPKHEDGKFLGNRGA